MLISVKQAANLLLSMNDIMILMHKSPDGDTYGSAMALYYGFKQLGKRSKIKCHDEFPLAFNFLKTKNYIENDFEHKYIVAVDVGGAALLGDYKDLAPNIDLCLDHHVSNNFYSKATCLDENAAATTELMLVVLKEMGVKIDREISDCLYTGLVTDTCCFKFANTTAATHRCAAELIEFGADFSGINNNVFTKTKQQLLAEKQILNSMEYYFDGACAVVVITAELMNELMKKDPHILDSLSGLARQVKGVDIGITVKELPEECKISVRCSQKFDANEICSKFGGGGHRGAAGCVIKEDVNTVKKMLTDSIESLFSKEDCL